jgi:Ca2+-binding EF-hand superfamily protein
MGNVVHQQPRVVLQEDVQLHFKAATVKEVEEVVHNWFEEGAVLGLTEDGFKKTLSLHSNATKFFQRFDTDSNKKVDAFEVLAALIVLANGTINDKIDTLFPVFDFSSCGYLNFDEMNILVHSTYRGLQKLNSTLEVGDIDVSAAKSAVKKLGEALAKNNEEVKTSSLESLTSAAQSNAQIGEVFKQTFGWDGGNLVKPPPDLQVLQAALDKIDDKSLSDVCCQMFDSHNLSYDQTISKEQFKRWLKNDIEATKFVDAYHCGYSLPDVEAILAKKEQRQAAVFSQLLPPSVGACVPVLALLGSDALKQSLDDPPPEIFENLVKMMATKSSGFQEVSLERFVDVNHAWNVFSIVDSLKDGALDPKELQTLMWLQHRSKPSEVDVKKEFDSLGIQTDGMISRTAWITANCPAA